MLLVASELLQGQLRANLADNHDHPPGITYASDIQPNPLALSHSQFVRTRDRGGMLQGSWSNGGASRGEARGALGVEALPLRPHAGRQVAGWVHLQGQVRV